MSHRARQLRGTNRYQLWTLSKSRLLFSALLALCAWTPTSSFANQPPLYCEYKIGNTYVGGCDVYYSSIAEAASALCNRWIASGFSRRNYPSFSTGPVVLGIYNGANSIYSSCPAAGINSLGYTISDDTSTRIFAICNPVNGTRPHIAGATEDQACPANIVVERESAIPVQDGMCTSKPLFPATGEEALDETDYAGQGADALTLVRSFRSSRVVGAMTGSATAGFGSAWSHNHSVALKKNGTPGSAGSTAKIVFGDGSARVFNWQVGSSSWLADSSADALTANTTGLLYTRQEDNSSWQFDTTGRLLAVTRRNGWVTTYTYSTASIPTTIAPPAGLLLTVTNQFGRSLNFSYNAASQLMSVTASDGQ